MAIIELCRMQARLAGSDALAGKGRKDSDGKIVCGIGIRIELYPASSTVI